MEQDKQDVCGIRVSFPVKSDEQAIEYKKKITVIFADLPEAQIQFSLLSVQIPVKPEQNGNLP